MTDILTRWNPAAFGGDWALTSSDLASGDDLVTAAIISLFTKRRALPSDPVPNNADGSPGDLGGWWADTGSAYPWGSRLGLLRLRKATPDVPGDADNYVREALQWMLDDGVAVSIAVASFYVDRFGIRSSRGTARLAIPIAIARVGASPVTMRFDWAWQQQIGN